MVETRSWKLLELLTETNYFFKKRFVPDARLQAELLLADVLEVERLDLYLQFDRVLTLGEIDRYRGYVKQRVRGIPLQYIVGKVAFRSLDLAVNPNVLIPRPETEVLVEVALEYIREISAPKCMDLCCGSGAIALSIAQECGSATMVGIDISTEALCVARENALRNNLEDRILWECSDLFSDLNVSCFDVIVSNPPYICSKDIDQLQPEVRDFEPHLALDGGEDGLDIFRRILVDAVNFLVPGGYLILEVGDAQADLVNGLITEYSFYELVNISNDLNGIARIVVIQYGIK